MTGFAWREGSYRPTIFDKKEMIVRVTGNDVTIKRSDYPVTSTFDCKEKRSGATRLECTDGSGGFLIFDPTKGVGAISQMLGAVLTYSELLRDTVTVALFHCSKF